MRGSAHRPSASECHYNGQKPGGSEKAKPDRKPANTGTQSVTQMVLVAPIMHKRAFDFAGQFGSIDERVSGCQRQGVIIPESRLKPFTCPGGMLKQVSRPPDKPVGAKEKSIPLVAVYTIFPDGSGGAGQAYQIIDMSA